MAPLWPQANDGEVERPKQSIFKRLKIARGEEKIAKCHELSNAIQTENPDKIS